MIKVIDSNGDSCIDKSDKQIFLIKNQITKITNKNLTNNSVKKVITNNVITKVSETFGNFTANNHKIQIFEIYRFY